MRVPVRSNKNYFIEASADESLESIKDKIIEVNKNSTGQS